MTLTFIDLVPIFLVFILYFMGMPIVYSLFGATFFYFLFIDATSQPWLILQKVMNSTQSFSMLAIPFFIMAGSVMVPVSEALFSASRSLMQLAEEEG